MQFEGPAVILQKSRKEAEQTELFERKSYEHSQSLKESPQGFFALDFVRIVRGFEENSNKKQGNHCTRESRFIRMCFIWIPTWIKVPYNLLSPQY